MASFANQFSFFLLLTLLSSLHIHARESQFFNKIPSTTNNVVVPNTKETAPTTQQQEQDPNFLPENENAYGLYGHESGQLPPSATTTTVDPTTTTTATTPLNTQSNQPVHKYLPKNYNPVAYVTKPEETNEFNEESSYTANPDNINSNNNYNGEQNYYNNQQQNEEESEAEYYARNRDVNTNKNRNYYYNNGGRSSFNSQPQGMSRGGATVSSRERYFNNGGESNGFQPQGMSDTRFVENGKYFYDVNTEKYSSKHPYESLKSASPARNEYYGNRNYYGNGENVNGYELNRGFQQQNQEDQFQDEENYNMPWDLIEGDLLFYWWLF